MKAMAEPGVWIGAPEFRMASVFLQRPIVVLVPSDGKSLTHFWTDKYIPDCHNQKAPLIIKSTQGTFR